MKASRHALVGHDCGKERDDPAIHKLLCSECLWRQVDRIDDREAVAVDIRVEMVYY